MAPPLWVRLVALSAVLLLAIYVFLFARHAQDSPDTEGARRIVEIQAAADIVAARTQARLAMADAALGVGARALAQAPNRPLDAVEAARTEAPETAFAVMDAEGTVRAAAGAPASAFRSDVPVSPGMPRGAPGGDALLIARAAASGSGADQMVARVPAPFQSAAILRIASEDGAVLAASPARRDDKIDDEGRPVSVASLVDWGGLTVVAQAPAPARGAAAVFDTAWVLVAPLVIGVGLTALLWILGRGSVRASRRWADSERRFRVAVEAARCGVWEWDLEREAVVLTDFMARMLGFERGGPVSADAVLERVTPRHRDMVRHALRQAAAYGAFDVTFRADAPGRPPVWIDARGQARGERDDAGFRHILGVAIDITEARRAKAQAQAAENRLRDGIESVSDAFVLFDRLGRLIIWNRAFQDTFGFEDHLLRRGASKDDLNQIAALAIRTDQPSTRPGVREVELHDGRWVQMAERFTGDGGSVVTATDITLIKRQEVERQRAADNLRATVSELETSQEKLALLAHQYEQAMIRAESANQAKSEFLANMSHELRTPLNAINGFSEIMAGEMFGPLGDARYKGYCQDILNSGQHLLALINDILDMAKIEAGKMTLRYEAVLLKDVCQDAIRLMRGRAEESGLSLTLDAPDLPEIEADYRALKQVLLNLLSNAIKFTPSGAITVGLEPLGATVRVSVADTGIGIAAEDLDRLTKPFEQVEGQHSKTTQGTGLGLALTKSLIEMHGGDMTIQSKPGSGTTISFVIPTVRPTAAPVGGEIIPSSAPVDARSDQSRAA